jgi:hypothetical protein
VLITVILALVLLGFAALGGWVLFRMLSGRRAKSSALREQPAAADAASATYVREAVRVVDEPL